MTRESFEHLSSLADPHILGRRLLEGPCSANKAAGNRQAIHRHVIGLINQLS